MNRIKICVVITASSHLWGLYRDQFLYLQKNGFDVTAIAAPGPEHEVLKNHGITTVAIPMKKTPAPLYDLLSLFRFVFFFLTHRFDVVSVSTPKASLLAGLGAFLTLQKKIIFTLRGRAYENKTGLSRKFFEVIDRIICAMSDSVFSISYELMDDFVSKGICHQDKIFVIGSGSSNGVDLSRFTRTEALVTKAKAVRDELCIPMNAICVLYSGRIRKDKGINELVEAFLEVSKLSNIVHLLIQGSIDSIDPLKPEVLSEIENNPLIHRADWCEDVEKYFAAADIFAFPSHREGFGNVAIEASSMELPVVAFDVVGCRESVQDGETGILCKKIDSQCLAEKLLYLIDNSDVRYAMGKKGRARVEREFQSTKIWDDLILIYRRLASSD